MPPIRFRALLLALASGLALLAVAVAANAAPITFAQRELVPMPNGSLTAGELDGSPGADLAGTRNDTVFVRRNLGARLFGAPQAVPFPGTALRQLQIADLDGDADLDLVAVNSSGLTTRLNLGGFAFGPVVEYPSGGVSACGDLNGDGRADVVMLSSTTLAAFLATPSGSLTPIAPVASPAASREPAIADLDGDHVSDLTFVHGSYPNVTLAFQHGHGDGTFDAPVTIRAVVIDQRGPIPADLDGDGDMDLLQPVYAGTDWLENDGFGHFTQRMRFDLSGRVEPPFVTTGDVDGDGRLDIVAMTYDSAGWQQNTAVTVVYAAADDTDRFAGAWHTPLSSPSRYALGIFDFDGDGADDVMTVTNGSSDNQGEPFGAGTPSAVVLWGAGDGTLLGRLHVKDSESEPNTSDGFLSTRWTGGRPDLVTSANGRLKHYRNQGNGTFRRVAGLGYGIPRASVDLNGDGNEDLVVASHDTTRILLRSGATFLESGSPLTGETYVALSDFNGDGLADLLHDVAGALRLRPGDGAGGFGVPVPLGIALPPHGALMAEDLDGNGRSDLVWTEPTAHSVHPYRLAVFHRLDDGAGGFGPTESDTLVTDDHHLSMVGPRLCGGDMDGDGDRDVVCLVGGFDSWLGWCLNDGAGGLSFSGATGHLSDGGPLKLADLDGDGLDDVIVHHRDGGDFQLIVHPATGGGTIGAPLRFLGADTVGDIAVEDFNGDGALDIAAIDGINGTLVVLRNTSEPDLPTPTAVSLVAARIADDGIALEWFGAGGGGVATVERSIRGAWDAITTAGFDGGGHLRHLDRAVERGVRYGYRLRYTDEGAERLTSETWIEFPRLALALRVAGPNPSSGQPSFALSLPARGDARVEVFDLSGRRVRELKLPGLAPGDHRVSLGGAALAPGVYHARLRFGTEHARLRFVTTR